MMRVSPFELADAIEQIALSRRAVPQQVVGLQRLLGLRFGVDEIDVSDAVRVIADREAVLGLRYPLSVVGPVVRVVGDCEVYEALLAQSRSSLFRDLVSTRVEAEQSKAFEDTVQFCLSGLFGPNTETVNFGWPSSCGRPQEFHHAMSWLCGLMGLPDAGSFRPPRRKDGGVDVVVWRSFGDGRPGLLLALVQATLEVDNLRLKASDVDVPMWRNWLGLDASPVVLLAIPGTVSSIEYWNEISVNALLLDRIRLSALAPLASGLSEELLERVQESYEMINDDLNEYA
jgi:hypothetical protein